MINPATEEACAVISVGTAADVDKAVKAARRAFKTFSPYSCPASSDAMAAAVGSSAQISAALGHRTAPENGAAVRT